MKRWHQLESAATPDGGVISLHERDGCYVIRVNGAELMSTRQHASEERLAQLACAHIGARPARALIGGLGLGFTLRAALQILPKTAEIVVAELIEAVISWHRNPNYPLAGKELADPRVILFRGDVAAVLAAPGSGFDAIMLDVDNGPAAMSAAANARLYQEAGVRRAMTALRAGGAIVYWSATRDPEFSKVMVRAGLRVSVERARSHATSRAYHTLFLGRRA